MSPVRIQRTPKGWYARCPSCGAELWLSRWKWLAKLRWWKCGLDESVSAGCAPLEMIWKEERNG